MANTIRPGTKGVITLSQFILTSEFLACSEMQRLWLQTLIETGFNYKRANETAFPHLTPRRALLYGYAVRRQPRVVAALHVYLGTDSQKVRHQESVQQLLKKVRYQLKHVETGSIAAQRFLAQEERLLLGGRTRVEDADEEERHAIENSKPQPAPAIPPAEPSAPKKFKVGDIVTEIDEKGVLHRGRVTEVDADGNVLDGVELES